MLSHSSRQDPLCMGAHPKRSPKSGQKNMLGRVRRGWMKFAELFGNFQMFLVLTLVYWIMILPLAIVFKLFADPLALKRSGKSKWIKRQPNTSILESMKKQG
jgi:fatty acid desaturase